MTFAFIEQHASTWPVRLMCRVLAVSPSGDYGWRSRPESARSLSNRQLLDDVRRIHAGHHKRYGSPRVHAALRAEGRTVSRGRVERLMRQHGIRALAGRRFRPCTTDSRHDLPARLHHPRAGRAERKLTPCPWNRGTISIKLIQPASRFHQGCAFQTASSVRATANAVSTDAVRD